MVRARIDREQAQQIMETCNPLGLVDVNKRLVIFKSPSECYYAAMKQIRALCPRGWLDVPYLMMKLQAQRISRAREFCGRKHYAVLDWDCAWGGAVEKKRNQTLRRVFQLLLNTTGINFSDNAFNMAVYDFNREQNQWRGDKDLCEYKRTNFKH